MFRSVLVANRGEIACRVLKTCRRLGIETIAVYSEVDADSLHVRLADRAFLLGPAPVAASYLNQPALLDAIARSGAEAVHPGYGLLSENAEFARRVGEAGCCFVGPRPETLSALGDKIRARELARQVGLMPPPGTADAVELEDVAVLNAAAEVIGYPLMVKAAAGGGGIGMQLVSCADELAEAARRACDRATSAFGDGRVYLERYLSQPRHIELQVARSHSGECWVFGDRECSVQRRHQKVIEESPSPATALAADGGKLRERLGEQARQLLALADYEGVGTVELLLDECGNCYFLEVNARLQVEHPVTELVHGLDLVELQLRLAAHEPLPPEQLGTSAHGHAVEARLYAEDPDRGFAPQPGQISEALWPEGLPGIRVDTGVRAGDLVTTHYDPLLAKLTAWGSTRAQAIARLRQGLEALRFSHQGPKGPRRTNQELLLRVLGSEAFARGAYDTGLIASLKHA